MKYLFFITSVFLFTNCSDNSKTNAAAVEAVKKEPKAVEVLLTDANFLYVSVIDDGTNRNGYAEYICGLVKSNNGNVDVVRIVKAGSTNDPNKDNAYGVTLGESKCQ